MAHASGWLAVTSAPSCFAPSSSCSHFLRRRARCCPAHERHSVARDAGHRVRPHATRRHLHHTARQVDARRRSAYRKQVRQLKAALRSAQGDPKDSESDDADRLALTKGCLKRVTAEPSTPEWLLSHSFKLNSRKGLVLSIGCCSNHASRARDAMWETSPSRSRLLPSSLRSRPTAALSCCRAVVLQQGNAPPPVDKAGLAPAGQ